MKRNIVITFRASEDEDEFILTEVKRLQKETGMNVSKSDVLRMGLKKYKEYLQKEKHNQDYNYVKMK